MSALVLAGCTSIPTTGAVHAGAQNGSDENGGGNVRAPAQPPVPGETPDEIVDGFRQASADAADLPTARAYLAEADWEPRQGIRVIDQPVTPSYTPTGDHATVRFVDKWLGTIAPDGTYQPQKQGTSLDYTYDLVKVKGEWRIVNPPDYSIATRSGIDDFYEESYYLYFLGPHSELLVPIRVFLPKVKDTATELISQLLQGPPTWLAKAGATTAIPKGTIVDSVSESSAGVVTVNLSAEFATLSTAERKAAEAQIVFTLQHYGSSGEFKIEAAGQVVADGMQSTASLSAYDPDAIKAGSFYYVDPDGRTRNSSGVPVSGSAGSGGVRLTTPVVAPRLADTSGSELIAGVERNGAAQTLYVGPLSAPKSVQYGAAFTTPSWDAFGNVWTVRQASATSPQQVIVSAVTQSGTTKFSVAATPDLAAAGLIESLKVSRDGTRVAMVARSTTAGTQILVGYVVKTPQGESIQDLYPVAANLAPVPDGIAWASSSTLDVLATAPGATRPSVWQVDIDGWQTQPLSSLPFDVDVVGLAAAPDQPLVIETRGGQIEVSRNDAWQVLGSGSNPSYPG